MVIRVLDDDEKIEDERGAGVLQIANCNMKGQTSDHNYSFLHVARHTFHFTSHPTGRQ